MSMQLFRVASIVTLRDRQHVPGECIQRLPRGEQSSVDIDERRRDRRHAGWTGGDGGVFSGKGSTSVSPSRR